MNVLNKSISFSTVGATVKESLREPGTQLGFWVHFAVQFVGNTFALMWAYPYLQNAQGMDATQASAVMTTFVVVNVMVSLGVGKLSAVFAKHRSALALCFCGVIYCGWALMLLWPGEAPTPVVFIAVGMLALSYPASMLAFDIVRSFNPPRLGGTATGLANVGGFVASLAAIYVTGLVLDLQFAAGVSPTLYDAEAFRPAIAAQALVAAIGIIAVLICTKKVRKAHGPHSI